jgi:hypothetical protein
LVRFVQYGCFNQVRHTVTKKVIGVFIAFFVRRFTLAEPAGCVSYRRHW